MAGLKITTGKPQLVLPESTVTSTLIVYGGKGMGKTNLGSVLVEELTKARLRWSVLDPLGVWWGLRHSIDGRGRGVECLILGGVHGDIPIEPSGGAVVADLVIDEDTNVVVDFSRRPNGKLWSKGERIRFATDYALRLYERQGELVGGRRRLPLFVVLDEAARYIPQVVRSGDKDVARCVGAWEDLVEEGRNVGIGVGLLTQRSARLNKSVAELADAMIAFRTVGPLSLGAVLEWLGDHVPKERHKALVEIVRALDVGSALVVSPGWLRFEDVVHIRARETFDSSATPKTGERRRVTGKGARPDLSKYQERMAATIERAKAEDPKELQKRIRELERQLRSGPKEKAEPVVKEVPVEVEVEVPVLVRPDLQPVMEALQRVENGVRHAGGALQLAMEDAEKRAAKPKTKARAPHQTTSPAPSAPQRPPRTQERPSRASAPRPDPVLDGDFTLGKAHRRILNSLAWWESVGVEQPTKIQVGFVAGYRVGRKAGGTFGNRVGELRSAGLIDYPAPSRVSLLDAGQEEAEAPPIPGTTEGLQDQIFAQLGEAARRILSVLIEVYPDPLHKQELGERAGYQVGEKVGGTFGNRLGELRSLGLVDYPSAGYAVAAPVLFLEAVPA